MFQTDQGKQGGIPQRAMAERNSRPDQFRVQAQPAQGFQNGPVQPSRVAGNGLLRIVLDAVNPHDAAAPPPRQQDRNLMDDRVRGYLYGRGHAG